MVSNLFRRHQSLANTMVADPEEAPDHSDCGEKLREYEEQLTYLSQQKELHSLALKEMYQFLIKLDTSVREEHKKLRTLIKMEQERSEQLIEITKDLWEIIESIDDGHGSANRLIDLTRDVEELTQLEVEVTDESENPAFQLANLEKFAPMMSAAAS